MFTHVMTHMDEIGVLSIDSFRACNGLVKIEMTMMELSVQGI
jgi:hypothetical protein